ncbi:MAG: DUF4330 domain-containing protein [Syntrophomonadaceae bacterium]|jgi:hypothetical protein
MLDEKGRLFGLINIIDLLVLVLIVVIALGFFYKNKDTAVETTNMATVKVICPYLRPEVAMQINQGDQLLARGQLQPVYIKEVEVVTARDSDTRADGELVLQQHPFRKDVYLTLEGPVSYTGAEIYMAGQAIRAGLDKYILKTQLVEVTGEILEIELE